MCWTFFFFWCSCIQPVLMLSPSWDLVTYPVVFGKAVELRCTVAGNASCCSKYTRIWSKGSKTILINGIPSLPSKYNETIDAANKQFSLIIYDLSKEDVDAVYTCAYGNISPQKTLTQNDSFEYPPTESKCPVKKDNGKLVGTLSVAMSAPYPSVFAQYGGKNFTSSLETVIAAITNSSKFYRIRSQIEINLTCGNNEKFTLSVLTGVTTTNICNNVDFCECGKCAGLYCLYSTAVTVIGSIIISISIIFSLHTYCQKCRPGWIPYSSPETVYGVKGTFIIFISPDEVSLTHQVRWYYVKHTSEYQISYQDRITTDSPMKDRVTIITDYKPGQCHLQLSDLRESDEGVYRCSFGQQEKEYKLKVLVSAPCLETVPEDNAELNAKCGSPEQSGLLLDRKADEKVSSRSSLLRNFFCVSATCLETVPEDDADIDAEDSGVDNPESVYGVKGRPIIFLSPYEGNATAEVLWYHCKPSNRYLITQGDQTCTDSPQKDRVSIFKDCKTTGKYLLQLSDLRESDEGVYRCCIGQQVKEYKLKVLDPAVFTTLQKILVGIVIFAISAALNVIVAIPLGYEMCFCNYDSDRIFIVFGVLTFAIAAVRVLFSIRGYLVAEKIYGIKGSSIIIEPSLSTTRVKWQRVTNVEISDGHDIADSPIKDRVCIGGDDTAEENKTTRVKWQRVTLWTNVDISDGCDIADSPIKDRVCIGGDDTAEENNLKLSNIQKSDQVLYKCIFGLQVKFYKLELLGGKSEMEKTCKPINSTVDHNEEKQ